MKKLKFIVCIIIVSFILLGCFFYFNKYTIYDSIVYIESINENYMNKGMGFVYKIQDNVNYIITNYHVVSNADELYIYNYNNKKTVASVVEYDKYTDIAILKVVGKLDLKEVKIGINDVKKNDSIYYFNISESAVKAGTVLSLSNEISINADYGNSFYNVISIKGDIESGNSGSPVLTKENEVIGVISLKEEYTDMAFYIPIDYVMNIVSKLENHTLKRPNLGATFINMTDIDILNQYGINIDNVNGVLIFDVRENYPLSEAGLIEGDVITRIDEVSISNVNMLQKEIYARSIGDSIVLGYYRNKDYKEVKVILNK